MLKIVKPSNIPTLSGRSVPWPRHSDYFNNEYPKWSKQVRQRVNYTCEQCGRNDGRMFADHIVELKDGGAPYDLNNGQCLCGSCHTRKTVAERVRR